MLPPHLAYELFPVSGALGSMQLLNWIFDDKRVAVSILFTWMIIVVAALQGSMRILNSDFMSFGPSDHMKFMTVPIDTWYKWSLLATATFLNTSITDFMGDSVAPWLQNTVQDHKAVYLPYSKFTCYLISQAWAVYCNVMSVFGVALMMSQIDLLGLRLVADLLVNSFTCYKFMAHKSTDKNKYGLWNEDRLQEVQMQPMLDAPGNREQMQTFGTDKSNKVVVSFDKRDRTLNTEDIARVMAGSVRLNKCLLANTMPQYYTAHKHIADVLKGSRFHFTGSGELTTKNNALHGVEDIDVELEVDNVDDMLELLGKLCFDGVFACNSLFLGEYGSSDFKVGVDIHLVWKCKKTKSALESMLAKAYNASILRPAGFTSVVTHNMISSIYKIIRNDDEAILLLGILKSVCAQQLPGWLLATAVAFASYTASKSNLPRRTIDSKVMYTNKFLVKSELANIFLQMIGYGKTIQFGAHKVEATVGEFLCVHFGDKWTAFVKSNSDGCATAFLVNRGLENTQAIRLRQATLYEQEKIQKGCIHEMDLTYGSLVRDFFASTLGFTQREKMRTFFSEGGAFDRMVIHIGLANNSYSVVPIADEKGCPLIYNVSYSLLRFLVIWFSFRMTATESVSRTFTADAGMSYVVLKGKNYSTRYPSCLFNVYWELGQKTQGAFLYWFFRQYEPHVIGETTVPMGSNVAAIALVLEVFDHLSAGMEQALIWFDEPSLELGTRVYACENRLMREIGKVDTRPMMFFQFEELTVEDKS